MQAVEKAGYKAGKDIYLGLDVRQLRVLQGRRNTSSRARIASSPRREFVEVPRRPRGQVPDRHHRGWHGRGRLGRAGRS